MTWLRRPPEMDRGEDQAAEDDDCDGKEKPYTVQEPKAGDGPPMGSWLRP